MHHKVLRTTLLGVGMSVLAALLAVATASAQVKPGDVITRECCQGQEPGFARRLLHGPAWNADEHRAD